MKFRQWKLNAPVVQFMGKCLTDMKYRKKLDTIEATQWFKNGDHPLDGCNSPEDEGKIVRYYPNPTDGRICNYCADDMYGHGYIEVMKGAGYIVCPGDWVITGINGEYNLCKNNIFKRTYESVE